MRKLLIGLAVLVVLLVVADRISVAVAENQISDRLSSAYGLPDKPGVTITGLPGLPVSAYSARLRVVVPLATLPLHLHLTSVHVTPDGLRIAASARHVQFART